MSALGPGRREDTLPGPRWKPRKQEEQSAWKPGTIKDVGGGSQGENELSGIGFK